MYLTTLLTNEKMSACMKVHFMRVVIFLAFLCTGTALHAQTVTVTSNNNPACAGASVTFTATVNPDPGTGTVQFFDGAASLGTVNIGAGGIATLTTSALAAGSHNITAVYSSTTSPALTQTINTL